MRGRVRWRRFLAMLVPSLLALGVLATGMAQGALPASFAVSGRQMKVSADRLTGRGLGLFPGVVRSVDGRRHVVLNLSLRTAQVYGLCQSALVDTPLGRFTVRLSARDRGRPSRISQLAIAATSLSADVDFSSVVINQDAGLLSLGDALEGRRGDFGLGAPAFTVRDVTVDTWMVTGGTFRVDDLQVAVGRGVRPCF
ncbi:cholesterol esterase [Nonomuraea phyllanthi]|uniref:DUF6230 family protein n=1 Tax=Nonomuraea phyllanthi TaxID=2219224 RepID=UPI0012932819|nr:DUF6230 family protein [Nonomuraea phyllanthi]QFY11044.1 cholesterol esterase [Nonomuraea phyllanthi]